MILGGSNGWSFLSTCTSESRTKLYMVWPTTLPKSVCLPSSDGARPNVMKNWLPFVFVPLPALAMPIMPRYLNFNRGWISSAYGLPYMDSQPSPVPVLSPPWIMKSLITRWNTVSL